MHTPLPASLPALRATHTRRLLIAAAVGGAVGASARWGIAELLPYRPGTIGWATLTVNLVGSVLIGLSARRLVPDTAWWAGLVTGGLGGFTTVSAFARELDDLFAADRPMLGVAYAAGTVLLGWVAVALATIGASPDGDRADGASPDGDRADGASPDDDRADGASPDDDGAASGPGTRAAHADDRGATDDHGRQRGR